MNLANECPSCHVGLEIRLDDDNNEERYCPQCGYWEYVDPELNEYEMDALYLTGEEIPCKENAL